MTARSSVPTICVGALWRLVDTAVQRGLSVDALVRATQLDPELLVRASSLPLVDRRFPVAMHDNVWQHVMTTLRDPALPVDMARTTRVDAFSLFGFLIKTSATIGAAYERTRRYLGIWTQGGAIELHDEGARLAIVYRRHDDRALGARCSAETVFAEIVAVTRELLGRSHPFTVDFAHAAPSDITTHRAYFKGAVTFGCGRNTLYVEREIVEQPLTGHDEVMASYFEAQAGVVLESLGTQDDVTTLVSRCLIELLPNGDANLETVAKKLATSTRTLRRRLDGAGTTFDALLTRTRRELADRYLRDPRVSIAETALMLGFSEQASFQRAYRRWTGTTPGAFRSGVVGK